MSCNLCESPGFLACTIKFALFHENRIFGRSQSLLLQTLKKNSALPRIRTREIESYSPFQECQQEARRKFSKATSGKDGKRKGISDFDYSPRQEYSHMSGAPLSLAEVFPVVFRRRAAGPIINRNVLPASLLSHRISNENSVSEAHANSKSCENLTTAVKWQDHKRPSATIWHDQDRPTRGPIQKICAPGREVVGDGD
jgi:hypothetical protein